MRIVFAANPALGHILPLLPLALAARAAGHELRVLGGRSIRPVVEAHGLVHVEAGPPDLATMFAALDRPRAAAGGARQAVLVWSMGFAGLIAPQLAAGLLALAEEWRPDVLVHEDSEQGTWLAAERLGIPHVALQATAWRSAMARLSEEPLGRLGANLGLAPDPGLRRWHRHGFLTTRPPGLRDPDDPMPPTTRPIRPVALDEGGFEAPTWLGEARDGRRRVAVTMGTVGGPARAEALAAIVRALAGIDAEVVVALGPDLDPGDLGAVPANVRVDRYVPMSRLLPASDAVVCHAGSGTVLAALAAGRPLVLLPGAADQPENARRCELAGAAIVLGPSERDTGRVRGAVDAVLRDGAWARAAAAVADEIAGMPEPAALVPFIESLART